MILVVATPLCRLRGR